MAMRSAIYYPHTEIRTPDMMRSSLLLWDDLNVIVPGRNHPTSYSDPHMAAAWELIGKKIVPEDNDKLKAHSSIEEMLKAGLPLSLNYHDGLPPEKVMELWPDKLSLSTWSLLQQHNATGKQLANGDYAFEEQAGTAVMSKLADACGGDIFARVTDKMLAFGMLGDQRRSLPDTQVVPMTLGMIDLSAVPLERLVDFRRREKTERGGSDYRAMRHTYADKIKAHVEALKKADNRAQIDALNDEFRFEVERSLKDLKSALQQNTLTLVLKPVVIATVIGAGTVLGAGAAGGVAAALGVGGAAVGSMNDIVRHIRDMFEAGVGFSSKQREIMSKNPVAYLYQLSRS